MTNAPFYDDICDGPAGGYALWANAADGVRLRLGFWPLDGARGTVLIFNGRTEYIEKYGHVAKDLHAAGYAVATLDWRGQGLSDRLTANPYRGHVGNFDDYQKDIKVLVDAVEVQGLPPATAVLAHSMGGCIGLRALVSGLPVKGAVFSAPMWGILMAPYMRPVAWALPRLARLFGVGNALTPGTKPRSFILSDPFENNTLTRDAEMWDLMKTQIAAVPEFELGGPSLDWLRLATDECATLQHLPAPDVPTLTFLGDNERIVDAQAVHKKMACWAKGTLSIVPEAEHEVFMEGASKRKAIVDQTIRFLDQL